MMLFGRYANFSIKAPTGLRYLSRYKPNSSQQFPGLILTTRTSLQSRCLRCLSITSSTILVRDKAARRARFMEVFSRITDELLEELRKENMPEAVTSWYKKNLDYNVPKGKLNRGMSVIDTVEIIKRRPLSEDEYLKAAILGWSIELLNATFIVADDIMDASLTRRNQLCWYRSPGVGMLAINDSDMLSSAIYRLLKIYFKNEPYHTHLMELFLESTWQTEIGQLIDTTSSPKDVDLGRFSLELQSLTCRWKAAYYSCYLPVASGMYMCGIPNTPALRTLDPSEPPESPYDVAKSILLLLGEYGQTQNDFFDFMGFPGEASKVGTDIITNKGSWCINTALVHATPAQRKILDEHYGKGPSGGTSELKVRSVFDEIGMKEKYTEYEKKMVNSIREQIAKIPENGQESTLRREVFQEFLGKIYKGK